MIVDGGIGIDDGLLARRQASFTASGLPLMAERSLRGAGVWRWADRSALTARLHGAHNRLVGCGTPVLPDPPGMGLNDPCLIAGVADITALIGIGLGDGASPAQVMPVIRETARRWLEDQVRAGLLPASAGGQLDELARAVYDRRYELGPVTAYLRDPQGENVDVNGCDQQLPESPTAD